MRLCDSCPTNPQCDRCMTLLGAGENAKKVVPPRSVNMLHLDTKAEVHAHLKAISRVTLLVEIESSVAPGRYEIQLDKDFRIIGSTIGGMRDAGYQVFDIEKVLRKEEYSQRLMLEEFQSWHMTHELEPEVLPNDTSEQERQLIRHELDKLAILHQLQELYMFMWQEGYLRSLGNLMLGTEEKDQLMQLIHQAMQEKRPLRDQLIFSNERQIFDVHIIPLETNTCGIGMINITEVIAKEHERRKLEWETCKSLLQIFTNGKLELIQDQELYELFLKSEKVDSCLIRVAEDLKTVRNTLQNLLLTYGMEHRQILPLTVAVNEAATNTLLHGQGDRIDFYVSPQEMVCRVVIYDQGKGLQLYQLQRIALKQGYTTRNSLGAGFHAMLTFADKVLINSSLQGTKVVLEIRIEKIV
ncbi:ATP-binding protein [Brevibacillus sp. SYSU BS000544]|uniref:ATP-binding protein n=1 Tax=Brevibacillus sp. SYSU BS000544 TaxID=3416443 RepID=UPI003CE516B2